MHASRNAAGGNLQPSGTGSILTSLETSHFLSCPDAGTGCGASGSAPRVARSNLRLPAGEGVVPPFQNLPQICVLTTVAPPPRATHRHAVRRRAHHVLGRHRRHPQRRLGRHLANRTNQHSERFQREELGNLNSSLWDEPSGFRLMTASSIFSGATLDLGAGPVAGDGSSSRAAPFDATCQGGRSPFACRKATAGFASSASLGDASTDVSSCPVVIAATHWAPAFRMVQWQLLG